MSNSSLLSTTTLPCAVPSRRCVESMGAQALAYSSAEEFLAAYDGSQSGCLVADMRLRGMSGIELLEALSRRPFRPPTLMVTAFADVPTAVRAMSLGAMTVLQKPYRDQELWDALGNALALSSHRRRDEAHVRERQARMAQLTSGETQVLDLIMAGRPNKGIARELGVGLRTVEGRRHSVMAKLGARSLAELRPSDMGDKDAGDSTRCPRAGSRSFWRRTT